MTHFVARVRDDGLVELPEPARLCVRPGQAIDIDLPDDGAGTAHPAADECRELFLGRAEIGFISRDAAGRRAGKTAPPLVATGSDHDDTTALFRSWLAGDSSSTMGAIRKADRELIEFKRNLNAAGERPIFTDVEPESP